MKQILIALDQLGNTFLGGMADETLSARAWRMHLKGHRWWGWTARAINVVFFRQANHCRGAYDAEIRRRHLPDSYS